jgi:alpha-beta hydrolase superfamily lysophospholipase
MNERARGDTPSFRRLVDDLAEFLDALPVPDGLSTRLPRFVVAISWGGKLALALAKRRPGRMDALALLCPGIFSRVEVSLGEKLGIAWARLVAPTRVFPIPLGEPELFTASIRWQEFIRNDPLSLREATARFLSESVRLDFYVSRAGRCMSVPVLLMLAEKDRIIDNARTRRYFETLASPDKSIREYENAHHTLEFEPDPDRFLADLLDWLETTRQSRL